MSDLLKRRHASASAGPIARCERLATNFASQQSGAVALLFGLLILPLLFAAGAAVDYGRRSGTKAQLDAALDAALIGVSARKTNSVTADMLKSAETQFLADAAKLPGVDNVTFKPTSTTSGAEVTLAATYTATVKTSLGSLMNINNMNISGRSETVRKAQQYIDFYLLLDNSPSMGIAATTAEIARMREATTREAPHEKNCEFACHQPKADGSQDTSDNYHIAKRNNIKLRIDNLREAVKRLVDTATDHATLTQQFRMEMWTFSDIQTRLNALTSQLNNVRATADGIDMASSYQPRRDNQTAFERALNKMKSTIPTSGTGLTSSDPIRFLFFVTDGVQDSPIDGTMSNESAGVRENNNRFISPINPADCKSLKDRNIRIGIIYTQYLPLTPNWFYDNRIRPFADKIGPMLESCASDGLYSNVLIDEDIGRAMERLFVRMISSVRITN